MRRVGAPLLLVVVSLLLPAAASAALQPAGTGQRLYAQDCLTCHGFDGRGVEPGTSRGVLGRGAAGPTLHGVGAASVDFYLTTGYMPILRPEDRPVRSQPSYSDAEIEALVAYVTSFSGGGPPIPEVHPERGDVAAGFRAFTTSCAGCHQSLGEGGVVGGGAIAPSLEDATPRQIAEAMRVGPNMMPRFSERVLDQHAVDSIAAYLLQARKPRDSGGASLAHVGPVTEGLAAWAVAGIVLVALARLLGKRAG